MSSRFIDRAEYSPVDNDFWHYPRASLGDVQPVNDSPGEACEGVRVASTRTPHNASRRYTRDSPASSYNTLSITANPTETYSERLSSDTETRSTNKEHPSESRKWFKKKNIRWWWWWEIGGSLLSIISISLLFPVLKIADNKPIEAWPYSIHPNSFISVLTTIGKTAMMVPITSCLGQLKWDHFQYRPNPLDHLQFYDDASRGPWGSFVLIASGRLRVVTAWALALVTLVALGIEPSAQQILAPLSREALLPNITAQIGRARNYSSKGVSSNAQFYWGGARTPRAGLFNLQSAIADGLVGSVSDVDFHCPQPATRCAWPPFTTLSVCSNFSDLTSVLKPNCTAHATGSETCIYNFIRGEGGVSILSGDESGGETLLNSTGDLDTSSGVDSVPQGILNGVRHGDYTTETRSIQTDGDGRGYQVFSMAWSFCLKTFHNVIASPAGILEADYTSEPIMRRANQPPLGFQRYDDFIANSTDEIFVLSSSVQTGLWMHLSDLLSREVTSRISGDSMTTDFSVGEFMVYADLKNMTRNVEEALSNEIRSSALDNEWAEMWPGQAFYEETYWHVYWAWIILPIVEVLLTASLLAISIFFARGQPLFKSSAIALLYHGLDYVDADTALCGDKQKSIEELEDMVRGIDVEFKKDAEGVLKFVSAEQKVLNLVDVLSCDQVVSSVTDPKPDATRRTQFGAPNIAFTGC
ncbi:hypothetical protein O1611_g4233 [Lasiodiplodia mahajangana]|uniref:Uncharacterized protein n=1 Tax=Lasiodiplodia mahajangana TaxID=1108764 RepID=A0ACC2JQD0_9PEZI|nr:hypothetical protein O1611_g4233 [Lasiodiplodia mahajangana]